MALRLAAIVVLSLFKSIFCLKLEDEQVYFLVMNLAKKLAFWTLLPNELRYQVEIKS